MVPVTSAYGWTVGPQNGLGKPGFKAILGG